MPPEIVSNSEPEISDISESFNKKKTYKRQIVWRNVVIMAALHIGAVYGLYLSIFSAKLLTTLFVMLLYIMSGLGITAGAHRLWSHRSYKAKWPLRLLLAFFNTIAYQNHIYEWSRDHRVHHKFSETNADPHNATRGFFFAHCGWLLCKKHPDVIERGKTVSCDDILNDPIVKFQKRYYFPLVALCCFYLPTIIPHVYWSETKWNAFFVCSIFRYVWTLNMTWLVNSAAHLWGRKPYDKNINPSENATVIVGAIGEGFHNYHHTFPWDYSTSELGWRFNLTTIFINMFAAIGWAYDLRTVSPEVIRQRKLRTGDVKEKGDYGMYN